MRWAGPRSGVAQDIVQRMSEISAVFIQQSIRLISLSVKAVSGTGNGPVGADRRRVREGETGGNRGIFMNFFIENVRFVRSKAFFGVSLGADPGHMSKVSMQFSRATRPCRSLYSAAGRLIVLMSSLGFFAATDSNCCGDWGGFVGDRAANWIVPAPAHGKVGGAETVERPGWSPGDGERRAPLQSLLDSDRQCAGCSPSTRYTCAVCLHADGPPSLSLESHGVTTQASALRRNRHAALWSRCRISGRILREGVSGRSSDDGGNARLLSYERLRENTRVCESLREKNSPGIVAIII